jgi:hypothetical protein
MNIDIDIMCNHSEMINIEKGVAAFFILSKRKFHCNNKLSLIVWMLSINQTENFQVEENVKWDVHVKYVSSKQSRSYFIIQYLKDGMGAYTTGNIYFAHCLRYKLLLWGGDSERESRGRGLQD